MIFLNWVGDTQPSDERRTQLLIGSLELVYNYNNFLNLYEWCNISVRIALNRKPCWYDVLSILFWTAKKRSADDDDTNESLVGTPARRGAFPNVASIPKFIYFTLFYFILFYFIYLFIFCFNFHTNYKNSYFLK